MRKVKHKNINKNDFVDSKVLNTAILCLVGIYYLSHKHRCDFSRGIFDWLEIVNCSVLREKVFCFEIDRPFTKPSNVCIPIYE